MSSPSHNGRQPRIIVVDDDQPLCDALKFSLGLQGFEVETCGSGEALLSRTLPLGNACLVIDQVLAGMSGLDTVRELRRRGFTLPAILITSNPRSALRNAAASALVPIVEKPLLGDTLTNRLRQALAGPSM